MLLSSKKVLDVFKISKYSKFHMNRTKRFGKRGEIKPGGK